MLTPNDIADQIEALVREKFPGEPVYRDLTPNQFQRPSTLIVQEPWEADAEFGPFVLNFQPVFTLTTFVPVDEYHHSHLAPMHLRQMALAGLFLPGYVLVGDRAPHVERLTMGGGFDFDTVTVAMQYTLDRNDFMELDTAPLAERMRFRLNVNEEGETSWDYQN
jgi:hypothetical protein